MWAVSKNEIAVPGNVIVTNENIYGYVGIKLSEIDTEQNGTGFEMDIPQYNQPQISAFSTFSTGSTDFANIVIFVRFAGEPEFVNSTSYNNISRLLNNTNTTYDTSLKNYIKDISRNSVNLNNITPQVSGTTYRSYQSTYTRSEVAADTSSTKLKTALLSALQDAGAGISSNVNLDGNADELIDNIVFIVSGAPQGWSDVLWPHQSQLSAGSYRINNKRP
jgi:hypothetical protein